MVTVHGATLVARPVEEVFDFVADERNEPRYNPLMVHAEKLTPGPVGEGTHWAATILARGRPLDLDIEVTDYARPHRLGSTTRMSTADIHGVVTFEPDPTGTRLEWSWDLRPKGVWRLVGPMLGRVANRQEAGTWAALKEHLERGRPRR